jgi:hypothetical protein
MKIEIKTLYDYHDCEACGGSEAEGGIVVVDGKEVLRKQPVAYCYDVPSYDEDALLVMALRKIGIDVFVDGERYQIYSHDSEYHGEVE